VFRTFRSVCIKLRVVKLAWSGFLPKKSANAKGTQLTDMAAPRVNAQLLAQVRGDRWPAPDASRDTPARVRLGGVAA